MSSASNIENTSPKDTSKYKASAADVFVMPSGYDDDSIVTDMTVTPNDLEHTLKNDTAGCIEYPADVMPRDEEEISRTNDPAISIESASNVKAHAIKELAVEAVNIFEQESATGILSRSLKELTIAENIPSAKGNAFNSKASTADAKSPNLGLTSETIQESKADISLIGPKGPKTKVNSDCCTESTKKVKSPGLEINIMKLDYIGHMECSPDVATLDDITRTATYDQFPNETKTCSLENLIEFDDVDDKVSTAHVTPCDLTKFDNTTTDCKSPNKMSSRVLNKKNIFKNIEQYEPTQPTLSKSMPSKSTPSEEKSSKSTRAKTTPTQTTPSKSTLPQSTPPKSTISKSTPFHPTPSKPLSTGWDFWSSGQFHSIPSTSTSQDGLTINPFNPISSERSICDRWVPFKSTGQYDSTQPTSSKLFCLSKSMPSKSTPSELKSSKCTRAKTTPTQTTPSKSTLPEPTPSTSTISKSTPFHPTPSKPLSTGWDFGSSGQFYSIPSTITSQDGLTINPFNPTSSERSICDRWVPFKSTGQYDSTQSTSSKLFCLPKSMPSKSTPSEPKSSKSTRANTTPTQTTPSKSTLPQSTPSKSTPFHSTPSKPLSTGWDFWSSGQFHSIPSTSTSQDGLTINPFNPISSERSICDRWVPFKSTGQYDSTQPTSSKLFCLSKSMPSKSTPSEPKSSKCTRAKTTPTQTTPSKSTLPQPTPSTSTISKSNPFHLTPSEPQPRPSPPKLTSCNWWAPSIFAQSYFTPSYTTQQEGLNPIEPSPSKLSSCNWGAPSKIFAQSYFTPSYTTQQEGLNPIEPSPSKLSSCNWGAPFNNTGQSESTQATPSKPIISKSIPVKDTPAQPSPSKSSRPQLNPLNLTPSEFTLFYPRPSNPTLSKNSGQSSSEQSTSTRQDGLTKNRNSFDDAIDSCKDEGSRRNGRNGQHRVERVKLLKPKSNSKMTEAVKNLYINDENTDDSDEDYSWQDQNSGRELHYHGQNSRNERQNSGDGVMRKSSVKMPTGRRVLVTIPVTSKCNCWKRNTETNLILLRPDTMGQTEYKIVEKEMKNTIMRHKTAASGGGPFSNYHIITIHKLMNCCLWRRFRYAQKQIAADVGFVDERMLFHGSTAVNHIVKTGFDERRANLNGMFGAGIYFAQHSSKSNQYVYGYLGGTGCQLHSDKICYICERKMLLCRVTLGKSQQLTSANKLAHPPPGYQSVQGVPREGAVGGLLYPEFVVYRGEQAYPEYLITYKIVK